LRDKGQHSNTVDTQSFRGTDCDTDHHLAVQEV